MADELKQHKESSTPIAPNEDVERKVDFVLYESQMQMTKIGATTNILAGLFVVWMIYDPTNLTRILEWYGLLVCINVFNICFSIYFKYKQVTPERMDPWFTAYHLLFIPLCLTWGSVAILFANIHPLYVITFLQVVLVGFSFGTITDFKATLISVICLLLPYSSYRLYLVLTAQKLLIDPKLVIVFNISLLILAIFLLITSYVGYKSIRRFFKLTFENAELNEKLENANQFLEKRVKERTIALEDSLKMVTHQATHDLLTDLPNQLFLKKYIKKAINTAEKDNKTSFAVACLTLNELEKINDGLGTQVGDDIIKMIAEQMKKVLKHTIMIDGENIHYKVALSRRDTFVIIIEPISDVINVSNLVQPLFSVLTKMIRIKDHAIKLTASVGVSLYPMNGTTVDALLMNANAAMFRAKQVGGNNVKVYASEMNVNISEQLILEGQLHNAIKNNEFVLYYQPFIDLKTGKIAGAEALVRWNNPMVGLVSPVKFIPLAEANGVIISLGEWVFKTACEQSVKWQKTEDLPFKMAINLSAKQLCQKSFIETVERIMVETGVNPGNIEIELTESEMFNEDAIPTIKKLKLLGFSLSIDDFGTGYSTLTALKLFEIDKIKIDQSFIRDIETSDDNRSIVKKAIELGKMMNVSVIAEGVENEEQLSFLKKHHCDMVQGYYFSKPVNAAEFEQLLEKVDES